MQGTGSIVLFIIIVMQIHQTKLIFIVLIIVIMQILRHESFAFLQPVCEVRHGQGLFQLGFTLHQPLARRQLPWRSNLYPAVIKLPVIESFIVGQ